MQNSARTQRQRVESKMKICISVGLMAFSILISCSASYPVFVKTESTGEEFVGTAHSSIGGSSFIVMDGKGTTCSGTYEAQIVATRYSGSMSGGEMKCSDGRTGTWAVSGNQISGQGIGEIDGQKIRIFYGNIMRTTSF
jgi:hypothetical protein